LAPHKSSQVFVHRAPPLLPDISHTRLHEVMHVGGGGSSAMRDDLAM
jgi:hypothetical protein